MGGFMGFFFVEDLLCLLEVLSRWLFRSFLRILIRSLSKISSSLTESLKRIIRSTRRIKMCFWAIQFFVNTNSHLFSHWLCAMNANCCFSHVSWNNKQRKTNVRTPRFAFFIFNSTFGSFRCNWYSTFDTIGFAPLTTDYKDFVFYLTN